LVCRDARFEFTRHGDLIADNTRQSFVPVIAQHKPKLQSPEPTTRVLNSFGDSTEIGHFEKL
jgi:hypothetical protein